MYLKTKKNKKLQINPIKERLYSKKTKKCLKPSQIDYYFCMCLKKKPKFDLNLEFPNTEGELKGYLFNNWKTKTFFSHHSFVFFKINHIIG